MIVADLTAQDVAALVTVVVGMGAVAAMALVLAHVLRTMRALRAELEDFHRRAETALEALEGTVAVATEDLERVDDLIGSAEALAATVDGAAKVGYLTVGKPVIKTVAFARGTSRAARRIRRSRAG